ncbi:endonuclease NucS [Candidatus Bathyarchaeota archaeon]|nr:endonuclease NucS [Candidatus Bathyarchaeota archaeon]
MLNINFMGEPLILKKPSVKAAEEAISNAIALRKTIIIVGKCRVEYKGRAESKLELGERIVLIKKDGALLIHRPIGYLPVNWQPSGCILQASSSVEGLKIKSVRRNIKEEVTVSFSEISLITVLSLTDEGEFNLYASEEDMKKAIILKPELIEDEFKIIDFEKKIEPGFIDVYGIDKKGTLTIIEIKRGVAGKEAVTQLMKYVNSISKFSSKSLRAILAAPKISKNAVKLLEAFRIEFKRLDPKACALIIKNRREKRSLREWV